MNEINFKEECKRIFKAELARRGIEQKELARMLAESGTPITYQNLNAKIRRGDFNMSFFLECLRIMGVRELTINIENLGN